jgi:hypothetical protein
VLRIDKSHFFSVRREKKRREKTREGGIEGKEERESVNKDDEMILSHQEK